jgi:two-component system sensor histidine kinase AtoS
MKKYVLLGLALMLFCFITGGIYIVTSINEVTGKLENVISFHQVEFKRANLEHHIQVVQSNLLLQGSPHSRKFEDSVKLIEKMEEATDTCMSCHHTEGVSAKLHELEKSVEHYMKLLSRTLTFRANAERLENARSLAFSQGEEIRRNVKSLSIASADKISTRITKIHKDINTANNILIACLILGPIAIFIITVFFLQRFTGSISTLIEATKTLESGDLDFRVSENLKDEFRTLSKSFNRMAISLQDENKKFESVYMLYQTLFESAGDAIMIISLDKEALGIIISANKASSELYGYDINELIGMDIARLVPPGKEKKFRDKIRTVLSGEWARQRVKRIRKDGSVIQVELSMGLLPMGDQKHLLSFSRDITEQLRAEEEMQRANQMTLVGQMAAGLAHEIKNPLAGVKVSLDVLASDLELQEEDQEVFARVVNEVNRMEKLLKNLLNYARPPQPHFDLVDINRLLDSSLKNVELTVSNKKDLSIHFERDLFAELPPIEADPSQLQQVLLNLFLNAIDSIESSGTITAISRMEGSDWIWIEILDTGKGMSEASLQKIFNPFFTTKSKGTGLGLSICKRLIEQNGGNIDVHSFADSGTSFVITLPLRQSNREWTDE